MYTEAAKGEKKNEANALLARRHLQRLCLSQRKRHPLYPTVTFAYCKKWLRRRCAYISSIGIVDGKRSRVVALRGGMYEIKKEIVGGGMIPIMLFVICFS